MTLGIWSEPNHPYHLLAIGVVIVVVRQDLYGATGCVVDVVPPDPTRAFAPLSILPFPQADAVEIGVGLQLLRERREVVERRAGQALPPVPIRRRTRTNASITIIWSFSATQFP